MCHDFENHLAPFKKCSFLHCVQGGLCIIEGVAVGSSMYDGISKFIFRKVYFYGDK